LEVLKRVFSPEKTTSFSGKFVSFPELEFYPKPKNLPIWIASGMNPIGYERVAKYGDGWLPGSGSPESFAKAIPALDEHMKKHDRSVDELDIGRQTFLCIGKTADQARKATEYTVRSFYGGHEFDAMRDRYVDEAYKTSFANTTSGVIKLTEQFLDVGVNFHDMRLSAPSLESALEMLRIFAREVLPSFA
jgi:alkanesulfonate monooxygenase SsuD/methylene tetrahydromethanopterin reductase-like flavin-dependent oxidoreductase (luciferase family)